MRTILLASVCFLSSASPASYGWMTEGHAQANRIAASTPARAEPIVQATNNPFLTQVVVRTIEQFHDHSDVVEFIERAAANGVSVVSLGAKQDEDDEVPSGEVFYRSAIAPIASGYQGFDVLADVIKEAHRRHLKVYAWVPQFHDQAAAQRHPDWQMHAVVDGKIVPFIGKKGTEYFLNPLNADVQQYELEIIKEIVSRYQVDGVALDWIRFDDYNMDMSDRTRRAFRALSGIDPATIDFESEGSQVDAWNAWRERRLAHYVKLVRATINRIRPSAVLGVYVLPPQFAEVGQNVALFAPYVDFISPMAYFADWGYKADWVYRQLVPATMAKADGKPVIPALDIWWKDAQYCDIVSHVRRREPEVRELAWFKYGKWTNEDLARTDHMRRDPCKH